jgi:GntR family transcriptional regulator
MTDPRLPRYQQIRDQIARAIAQREWGPGEAIPTENELAKAHGVAIGTVRKAIDLLVSESLVERVHGKGTFVRRPTFSNSLFRFFRYFSDDGETLMPGGLIQDRKQVIPPEEVRKALSLRANQEAIQMRRLRTLGHKVVLVEDIWLPADKFPGFLDLDTTSLEPLLYPAYETLYNVLIVRAEETLSVSLANSTMAKTLGLHEGAPLMVIERCAFDQDGRPVEWRRSHGPAMGFQYKVEVR